MGRILLIFVVLAGVALGGTYLFAPQLLGLSAQGPGGPGGGRRPPVVGVGTVEQEVFRDTIEAVGTGDARESVTITAKVADTVGAINFAEGEAVEAGRVLIEMTSAEQAADLAAARASLSEAQKAYDRAADLVRRGIAPQAQLDSATAARDAARSRVNAIEARLADTIIKAPFAGVVGLRNVSVGSFVRPGDVMTTLDDTGVIKADFSVPERYMAALKPGLTITAAAAAFPGESFGGTVASIDTRVNPATRAVAVRGEIPNADGRLRPGMLLAVSLVVEERTSLSVPEAAIVPQAERRFVFRIDGEGNAQRVEVQTGLRKPGFVEILSGLAAGDRIVVEGTNKVQPGQKVQAAEDKPVPAGQPTAQQPGSGGRS